MKNRIEMYKGLGGYGTLGLEIVFSMLLGLFGGKWLDERYGTRWIFWAGLAFGIALSVRAVQRAMKLMRVAAEREEREQGNPAPLYETDADRARRHAEERLQREVHAADEDEEKKKEEPS